MLLQPDKVFCKYNFAGQDEEYFDEDEAIIQLLQLGIVFVNLEIGLIVNCSDIFVWACSDGEQIKTIEELKEIYKWCVQYPDYGSIIWCCIKRNMQPQSPVAKRMKEQNSWPKVLDSLKENTYDIYLKEQNELQRSYQRSQS